MKVIFLMTSIILLISMIMIIMSSIMSKKTFMDREKNSPFECGFDPFNSPRMPFSLHFFLIAVIFLIFDVEITMLIPLIQILLNSKINEMFIISTFFILILLLGVYHEWKQGALHWSL
uniref:NADH-ubiquinone oxidoreductase chain 3 n=1 Tax=Histeroidea sp. 5 KM-2017 TaxID=2219438 RepID=A0A346RGU8_9COLE|nr:NADH dehydrogenase subunit 3 [Histeroidea sp. 5 KM-2017]